MGAAEFKDYSFRDSPVYLDTTKAFYRFIGAGSLIWADPSDLTSPEAKVHGDRARAKKVKGNMKGEGRIMGGLVVVNTAGAIYIYNEKIFGDHAPLGEVAEAARMLSSAPSARL
ncbi:hypothetical protein DFJ74DRAFT_696953 [Hyaloraphidium curvatum]|nr:hypothetical protein DFJ74DRAFT_696953 [Hyaloraphidium curvatum]